MKRKKVIRAAPEQAVIAGNIEDWQHIILMYQTFAKDDPQNRAAWQGMVDWLESALADDLKEREEWLKFNNVSEWS